MKKYLFALLILAYFVAVGLGVARASKEQSTEQPANSSWAYLVVERDTFKVYNASTIILPKHATNLAKNLNDTTTVINCYPDLSAHEEYLNAVEPIDTTSWIVEHSQIKP